MHAFGLDDFLGVCETGLDVFRRQMVVLIADLLECLSCGQRSRTSSTLIRVPLITGLPTSTSGSATIRARQLMSTPTAAFVGVSIHYATPGLGWRNV